MPHMKYIGCDFHPSFQVIAMLDKETGELVERRLLHTEEARAFYEGLQGPVLVGIEASGNTHWFESLLARCQHELWIGDAAAIAREGGRNETCGSCWSIVSIWCGCGHGSRTSCNTLP